MQCTIHPKTLQQMITINISLHTLQVNSIFLQNMIQFDRYQSESMVHSTFIEFYVVILLLSTTTEDLRFLLKLALTKASIMIKSVQVLGLQSKI